jgi:serine/threonine protein kinase
VAAKTLKQGSGERETVKLLQEAAIMAQFKHPNVITLYCVVSTGGVVSFVKLNTHYSIISQWYIVEFTIKSDNDYCGIAAKRRPQTTSDCHEA